MKRIVFGLDFDGGAWPGPLAERDAAFGEAWVGPAGFLDVLETALGLGGPRPSTALRAAELVPGVRAMAGFWSASADIDPFGVAAELLRWRDSLRMHGWSGQAVSQRLGQLGVLTAEVKAGLADRLADVAAVLARRDAGIETIELLEPREELPFAWRAVLAALEARGTRIAMRDVPPAPAMGDLSAARSGNFVPRGDGTLSLVRPLSSIEAAEALSAWLASRLEPRPALIVGGDAILDAALKRHGLPATGAALPARENVLLQLLPLVLAAAWVPADPRRMLELLAIDPSPAPRSVSRRLIAALGEWPAVGSDAWEAGFREGLESIEDPERRARVTARLDVLLLPTIERHEGTFPAREVHRRVDALSAWLRGRLEASEASSARWASALAQCKAFLELIAAVGLDGLREPQLAQLVSHATEAAGAVAALPAEAGHAAVASPGAVAGPAERIVWWSFTAAAVHPAERLPLTPAERSALAAAGVPLPDPGLEAIGLARRWRRPLQQATGELVLVAPLRDEKFEESYPHPLWDEIEAALAKGCKSTVLVRREPIARGAAPGRRQRPFQPLPVPREVWPVDAARIAARETESASSLAELAGCPFKWSVHYAGRIRAGQSAALPSSTKLDGSLVHEIVARTLEPGACSRAEAPAVAGRIFDAEAPRLASELFLPGADARHARLRALCVRSVTRLSEILEAAGLEVVGVEAECSGTGALGELRGRIDLLAGPRPVVIDLKLGGETWRRESLVAGTAHQLAVYAALTRRRPKDPWPAVAFFILDRQRLLTTDAGSFGAEPKIDGPGPAPTFDALVAAVSARRRELAEGRVVAPANGAEPRDKDGLVDGALALAPPCDYCDFGALCGASFGEPG